MRGIPGLHVSGFFFEARAVMMADDGRAFGALRPVPTRGIAAGGRVHTLRVGTRQNVVRVHGVAAAADNRTLLGQPSAC